MCQRGDFVVSMMKTAQIQRRIVKLGQKLCPDPEKGFTMEELCRHICIWKTDRRHFIELAHGQRHLPDRAEAERRRLGLPEDPGDDPLVELHLRALGLRECRVAGESAVPKESVMSSCSF